MEAISPNSENILILALTGSLLCGAWLAYQLKLFKFFSTINDEKKILLPSFLFLISPFLLPFIFSHNMLPESPAVNFFLSGTLSSVITGIFLIINTERISSANNKIQLEREEQQRIWQQKSDQQKWYREKIYASYKKAIQLLTDMLQLEYEIEKKYMINEGTMIKFNKLSLELEFEFDIITSSYPIENYEEFFEKMDEYSESFKTDNLKTRSILIELMENDSRIISINK